MTAAVSIASPANRRGACPALTAPMQTGDGLLVRLNPVSQGLTPKQLIGLCKSATRHGNGIVEITARGSIQIRGLTAASVSNLATDVNALSIDVRTGVPVETSPLAGLDPTEITDPRPLAAAIRAAIEEAGLASRLGPKVSVIVDGRGWNLDAISADVRCVAARSGDTLAWQVAIGGDVHGAKPFGLFFEKDTPGMVVSILASIAELGVEGRARDLPSPLRGGSDGEVIRGGGQSKNLKTPPPRLPPLALLEAFADPPHKGEGKALGLVPVHNSPALAVALPFGSVSAETLIGFTRAAKNLGATEFRPAPSRTLIVLGLDAAKANILQARATALGFITDPADPRASISACPGAPACASGHIPTREIATDIATAMPELLADITELHVSGCSKGCAHPAPAALTLVGDKNGIGLVVNGTARHTPLAYTQMHELKQSLRQLAATFRQDS